MKRIEPMKRRDPDADEDPEQRGGSPRPSSSSVEHHQAEQQRQVEHGHEKEPPRRADRALPAKTPARSRGTRRRAPARPTGMPCPAAARSPAASVTGSSAVAYRTAWRPVEEPSRSRDGEHREAAARVVLAVEPADREKVRQLPEEEDREEGPAGRAEAAARGRPAHQRRQRARDRADDRAERGHALQRRVGEDVREQRRGAERERQQVDAGEDDEAGARRASARRRSASSGAHAPGGQRPAARARHARVRVPLEVLVERRGAAAQQRGPDQEEQEVRRRRGPLPPPTA